MGDVESRAHLRTNHPWEGPPPTWRTPTLLRKPPPLLGRPCGEPRLVTHTHLHTRQRKPPQNHTTQGVVHEISTPWRGLWAGGNPLAEAKERLAQQGDLSAQLAVVAHLSLDLGAGVDDGGVVAPPQGGADANQ